MIARADLPHILAVINAATVIVLLLGLREIRARDRHAHRRMMLIAVALGAAFLVIYLYYHLGAGLAKFGGQGVIRPIYFTLLIVHIIMAAVAAVIVPMAVFRALNGRFEAHKALARWAWSIWIFVSLSGLAVYAMTIHLFPFKGPLA